MIDVSTFSASIPAGTYSAGDIIELKNTAGPAVVRSGRGPAFLKRISSYMLTDVSGAVSSWQVFIKNSDWIDEASNIAIPMNMPTSMDERSGAIQPGHDCELTPNSSWQVYAKCIAAATTTIDNGVTADIEIDYTSVSAIIDPSSLPGIPCSITHEVTGNVINASGAIDTAGWQVFNVDIFKAGYAYALEKIELICDGASASGYISLENAAGMGGLQRIIPICSSRQCLRPPITYSSRLVKGPMDIKYKLFNTAGAATTGNTKLILDFVKRKL